MAKVLLVEDDNNLREIYEARLQAEGYEISSAQDGEQALVVAKQFKPDLIISDVMMPKISGFEMLDILRNTEGLQQTRVIMLTALGQAEDKSRADSLGADRYLVKSQVTLEDIVKAAHEILDDGGASATPAVVAAAAVSDPAVTTAPQPTEPTVSAAPEPTVAPTAPEPVATPEPAQTTEPVIPSVTSPTPAPELTPAPEPVDVVTPDPSGDPIATDALMNPVGDTSAASTEPAGDTAAQAADSQLVADAAQTLAGAAPEQPADAMVTAPPAVPPQPVVPTTDDNTEAVNDPVTIGRKKVIEPIGGEAKPDINELLAKETAAAPVIEAPVVASEPTAAPAAEPVAEAPAVAHQPGDSFTPQAAPEVAVVPETPEPTPEPVVPEQPPADPAAPAPAPTSPPADGGEDPDSIAL